MKNFRVGYIKIRISKAYRSQAMNAILINQLSYKSSCTLEDEGLEIKIKASMADKFKSVFEDNAIEAIFSQELGTLAHIARYKYRFGVLLGAFMIMIGVYLSSLFVWRIDIEGNASISDDEILNTLSESGFSLGSFIPTIDYDSLHNKFLLNSENISWISVNIKGNVATVLVKERLTENEKPKDTYTNVVASSDAQIILIQLYNGKKMISIGDVVRKGDVLISGVINSQSQGVRYVHADGIVKGYVNKSISVKIPLNSVKKVYTGREHTEKSIKFFSKTINFSPKYRNSYNIYDKIYTSQKVRLFGRIELPIEISTIEYKEFEEAPVSYSYEMAVDMAFSELRYKLDEALLNAELVSKNVKTRYDDSGFYIDCELYCIENIASLVEFEVE